MTLGDGVSHLQQNPEHKMIVTAKKGSNGRVLRVRCKCMAEYRNVSDHYYNYDPLGDVKSIDEALKLYKEHLAKSEQGGAIVNEG